ncbi:hypothetical protein HOT99_gp165 [Caulobacter phage CcrBL10]|uniref:Uncharacterized protein n=1 Tax=Caulobacter phage CcrBL10 TaxID=2283269 RepID=A0A385EC63_9CAUD|nr:hypothetical protein HOT99_gp165 [Caulobacter phage CcrBL10]AXQ68452.1 hypothetical protein CcrBL10_gp248 [Caulobacter phage CcrBL10]
MEQDRKCPHCGTYVPVYDSMADVLERMEGRIEELEDEVKALKIGDGLGA